MDVRMPARERVFSILNDNDSPSFQIRHSSSSAAAHQKQSRSPKQERPSLLRQSQYKRTSSFSSSGISSPPLLRFDSSSSRSSGRSMDSTPSPLTPAYGYPDAGLVPYDNILRQDLGGYIPSTITPFMEQQLMIAPTMPEQFPSKQPQPLPPVQQYPILPAISQTEMIQQLPTPNSSTNSLPVAAAAPANTASNHAASGKKNKYPCPYSQSHSCTATFTTSGHAARHGKKHTGEKGVHCPVCNKAFTRKDNMKQHERTHKGSISGSVSEDSNPRRSKAALTRDAQKTKTVKKQDSISSDPTTSSTLVPSPLSQTTSISASNPEMPIALEDPTIYPEPSNSMLMPIVPLSEQLVTPIYPPISDELLASAPAALPMIEKPLHLSNNGMLMQMPPMTRGFSDLDTLAQAAETFDQPYYQPGI